MTFTRDPLPRFQFSVRILSSGEVLIDSHQLLGRGDRSEAAAFAGL